MLRKAGIMILAGTIAVSAAGCSLGAKENMDKYTATVEAESFYIASEINGKVTELSLEQGAEVKVGQKLAQIDVKSYEIQKQQAEAALRLAQLKKEEVPDKAKDNIKEQAKAAVEQAQAAVDLAQLQIDKAQITASIEGTVTDIFIHKGEMALAGMNIAKAIDLKNKYIKVYMEEEKRSLVKLGDVLPVYAEDKKLSDGKIIYIALKSEFTPKNVEKKSDKEKTMFEVKLKLEEAADVSPGMFVDVEIK
jgi:HlyD family secretion protein